MHEHLGNDRYRELKSEYKAVSNSYIVGIVYLPKLAEIMVIQGRTQKIQTGRNMLQGV